MSDRFVELRARALGMLGRHGIPAGAATTLLEELQVLHAELEVQQEELRESQARSSELAAYYQQLFDEVPTAFVVLGTDRCIKQLNRRAAALFGLAGQVGPLPFEQFVAAEEQAKWATLQRRATSSAEVEELELRRRGGERRRARVTVLRRGSGDLLLACDDVTTQRQAEREQRIVMERYSRLLRDSRDGVLFVTADTRLVDDCNDALAAMLGTTRDRIVHAPIASLFPRESRARQELVLRKAEAAGSSEPVEVVLAGPAGRPVHTEVVLSRLEEASSRYLALVVRDVTARVKLAAEREALTRAALETQKFEAVGQLAAGVAHDMNNVLTAILSCAESEDATPEELAGMLAAVRRAALRGRELTGRLSALFQRHPLRSARFDMAELVREVASLVGRTFPPSIRVRLGGVDTPVHVEGDAGAWHQALLNLAINARDAMPKGGHLDMAVSQSETSVEVSVEDDGMGMPAAVRARAMEPFFTTKPLGQGTGLGLAHVNAVVRAHGGEISCVSEQGKGTRFRCVIPHAKVDAAGDEKPALEAPARPGRTSLAGHVLLVDDDELARSATSRLLKMLGATPLAFATGEEALGLLESGREVDVVLTDLAMPGLDGEMLAREIRTRRPGLPVVVFTGDVRDDLRERLAAVGVSRVLSKPFTPAELVDALDVRMRRT